MITLKDPVPGVILRLGETCLFDGITAGDILKYIKISHYQRGEFLFYAGDRADTIFVLLDGIVKVSYVNPGGDEKIISIFQPGDIFGELFLGKYRSRIGIAQALENVTAAKIGESHLYALIREFPDVGLNFIRHLADEQRETLARLHALMHVDARHRLLGTLLHLARRYCCSDGEWFNLPPRLTQEDIASIACLNRSTASLLINELRRQGILGGKRRTLTVNRQAVEALLREAGLEILE
jgi:CRP-like cAMP-binding protein